MPGWLLDPQSRMIRAGCFFGGFIMGYLCLTRRPGESLILYDSDIKPIGAVKVQRCKAANRRIAFDLPGIRVVRAELTKVKIGGQDDESE